VGRDGALREYSGQELVASGSAIVIEGRNTLRFVPLHRAVRNRCAAAVRALIEGGADPEAPNSSGSTPMLLATQNTGRAGSGTAEAKAQQLMILRLLEEHGAT